MSEGPRPDSETPFFGLPEFDEFTEAQKRGLFMGFVQVNAEVTIHLESLLICAFKEHRLSHEDTPRAEVKMTFEEFHHSRAFRRFLWYEPDLQWPRRSLLIKRGWLGRRLLLPMAWIARHFPQSIFLVGAKLEAYSVEYAKSLHRSFGSWDANAWTQLNYHHFLDEAQHVHLQLEVHDQYFQPLSWMKKAVSFALVAVFFLFMQWVLLSSCHSLLSWLFPDWSFWKKIRRTLRMGHWIVRCYAPYSQTRRNLDDLFRSKKPWAGPWFRFIYW